MIPNTFFPLSKMSGEEIRLAKKGDDFENIVKKLSIVVSAIA